MIAQATQKQIQYNLIRIARKSKILQTQQAINIDNTTQKFEVIQNKKQVQMKTSQGKSKFECMICKQKLELSKQIILPCFHAFCKDCMQELSILSIQDYKVLKCPDADCFKVLNIEQVADVNNFSPQIQKRFKRFKTYFKSIKDSRSIICPNEYCDEGLLYLDEQGMNQQVKAQEIKGRYQLTCKKCGYRFCGRCLMPPHEEPNCRQFYSQLLQIQNRNYFRRCGKCKNVIQKLKGCNHMVCKCGYQFCFKCNLKWRRYHACNPFAFKEKQVKIHKKTSTLKLQPHNHQNQPNYNSFNNRKSADFYDDEHPPQCADYSYYVFNFIMKIGWSIVSILFFVLPMLIATSLIAILTAIGMILVGITYGYGTLICQARQNQNRQCWEIVKIVAFPIGMVIGIIRIFQQNNFLIRMMIRKALKFCDFSLPFQIIPEQWIQ